MKHGSDTLLIVSLLGYGTTLLLLALIWFRTPKEREPLLFVKLMGYTLLAMFRFSFNQLSMPLGLIAAILLVKRTNENKKAKLAAVWLGGIMFLAGFLPVADWIENTLYPRTEMSTYLHEDLTGKGFAMNVASSDMRRFYSKTEKDESGRKLYAALRESRYIEGLPLRERMDEEYELKLFQDTDNRDNRFKHLEFRVASDGSYLKLRFEDSQYVFRASREFQQLFQQMLAGEREGSDE